MRKNRVAFYTAAWRGGAGWYVHSLAAAIAEAGTAITLLAPLSDPPERDAQAVDSLRRVVLPRGGGGKGTFFYRATRSGWRILSSFIALLRVRCSSSLYLITLTDWLLICFFQLLLVRMLGARLVYIVHDAKPHAWAFPNALRWLEVAMLKGSFRLPTHIVTLTHAAKQQLVEEFGIGEQKISVIPHGVFESPSLPGLSGDSKLLLFGMLRRNKHILETIEAMWLLPEDCRAKLIIAGAIHAEDAAYWTLCNNAIPPGCDRIRTEIGFVPETRVQELLAECDAVLLPYEDFNSQSGVAILAGLAGRSLIATDVGGIGELIAGGVAVTNIDRLVSAQTIAAAVRAYLGRPAAERRAEAGKTRELLKSMLSWRKIGQSYATLLKKTAEIAATME